MRSIFAALFLVVLPAVSAQAQGTRQTTGVPTPRVEGPFSSDWARPFPQTGGQFYDDPRWSGGNRRRIVVCPRGMRVSAYSGRCYRG